MGKLKGVYHMLLGLYAARKYDEVINIVDKLLFNVIKKNEIKNNFIYLKAKSLRYLGKFDEAISLFDEICRNEPHNSFYNISLFFTYYYVGKYKLALELLPKLYLMDDKNIANYSLSVMELVMRKNLGLPVKYSDRYVKRQIIDYDEQLALDHITHHKYVEKTENVHSVFNESIDIKYLMESVKENLKNSEKANVRDILEIHYFSVSGVGYDDNNICNYLKVVVCPETTNIITMYPYAYPLSTNIPILDCDNNKLFKRDNKQKIISRIDKFNKKFNLN